MKKEIMVLSVLIFVLFSMSVRAQSETVGILAKTGCCEKTNSGLFCQEITEDECNTNDGHFLPTSCKNTAFCSPGWCRDPTEGTCLDNVPFEICQENGGTWDEKKPDSCNLGCCTLGDQASFVTLTRCSRLSSFYGLETSFDSQMTNQDQCSLSVLNNEKGACVYNKNFEVTCKFIKREDCTPEKILGSGTNVKPASAEDFGLTTNSSGDNSRGNDSTINDSIIQQSPPADGEVAFHSGILCSAPELNTICGPTEDTTCLPGKEEIYFVDTCGNPANIYDSSRVRDVNGYWTKVVDKTESCNSGTSNSDSQSCGNCNYLMGSYCRESEDVEPVYGGNICANLNCVDKDGVKRIHGESWCSFDGDRNFVPAENNLKNRSDKAIDQFRSELQSLVNARLQKLLSKAVGNIKVGSSVGKDFVSDSNAPVGSRFFKHVCINGEVKVEPCADFRQGECIENKYSVPGGATLTEASCRENRWQDCTAQHSPDDCGNSDIRDCVWYDGIEYMLFGSMLNGSAFDLASISSAKKQADTQEGLSGFKKGACVPKNPPGLKFWDGKEAKDVCSQANAACPVTFEKGLGKKKFKCVKNCECLPGGPLELKRAQLCMQIADCGPKTNYIDQVGNTQGYSISKTEVKQK